MRYGSKQTVPWEVFLVPALALCVFLVGCTPTKPPSVPPDKGTVNFDKRLLQDCDSLPMLEGSTDVQIKNNYEKILKMYGECSTNKKNLNAEVKKAFNIKD